MNALLDGFSMMLPIALMFSTRVAAAFATLPAPFGDVAPVTTRAVLGVIIGIALTIPHMDSAPLLPTDPLPLVVASVGEGMVGAVIGLTVRMTLAAAEIAGTLAGTAMGLGFATSVDPTFGDEALPTTKLFSALGALIFFVLNGHHTVLAALNATFRLAPPGHAFAALAMDRLINLGAGLMAQGLRIAAPVVATMLIVQVGTALVAKAAPRVQVFGLTFALSSSVGLVVLYLAVPGIAHALGEFISQLPSRIDAMFVR